MNILFLDHDGVICLNKQFGSRYKKRKPEHKGIPLSQLPVNVRFDNFDKKSVKVLNEIIADTDCEIVISSDWKLHATVDELGDYYESQGIIKRPIDVTKNMHYDNWKKDGFFDRIGDFHWHREIMREQNRYCEIMRYIEENSNIEKWVAVDDMDLGRIDRYGFERDWGLTNFVHIPRTNEGIKQSNIKEKIIEFFR